MPKAVSDSSTLIHLAGIGRLKLLRQFYKKILIPPAVWKEVVEEGQSRPGAREVEEGHRSGWIAVSVPLRRLKYISKFEFLPFSPVLRLSRDHRIRDLEVPIPNPQSAIRNLEVSIRNPQSPVPSPRPAEAQVSVLNLCPNT